MKTQTRWLDIMRLALTENPKDERFLIHRDVLHDLVESVPLVPPNFMEMLVEFSERESIIPDGGFKRRIDVRLDDDSDVTYALTAFVGFLDRRFCGRAAEQTTAAKLLKDMMLTKLGNGK